MKIVVTLGSTMLLFFAILKGLFIFSSNDEVDLFLLVKVLLVSVFVLNTALYFAFKKTRYHTTIKTFIVTTIITILGIIGFMMWFFATAVESNW